MNQSKYSFQYCQKIILLSEDWKSVLLAKRRSEEDYDGTFSFIGGKMETSDASFLEGLRREKNEEIGEPAKIAIYLDATHNAYFYKQDGSAMILPHYLAHFVSGDILLNPAEYSEYRWVALEDLSGLTPKIENIPDCVDWALQLKTFLNLDKAQFVEI